MSMFVFLNSTFHHLKKSTAKTSTTKNISIKQHIKQQKYLFGRNIDQKPISIRKYMVYYYCLNIFLHVCKIFHLTEQDMYVQET